jgi:hypothetical protein
LDDEFHRWLDRASKACSLKVSTDVTQLKCSKLLATAACQLICVMIAASTAAWPSIAYAQQPRGTTGAAPNWTGAAVSGFQDRVKAYIELQKKADDGLPKLSDNETPSQIEAHQAAMAARMKLARPNAKPGEIFGDAAPVFRQALRQDAHIRSLRDARAAMEEVPKYDPPKVNAAYPEKSPLATMPPLILDALPRLPEGLEYRFMGNDLILRDVQANLVADFIENAVVFPKGK